MFHRNQAEIDPEEARPCFHMRTPLSQLADGTAQGLLRWLAEHHVAGCPQCTASLQGLRTLRGRLHAIGLPDAGIAQKWATARDTIIIGGEPGTTGSGGLSPKRRAALEAAWTRLEAEREEQ